MSEISREAMEYFKKCIEAEKHIINLPTCDKEVVEAKEKHIAYFKQAISDMEKLEKIEQIVDEMWDEDSYYNNTVRFAEKIEQIVKG